MPTQASLVIRYPIGSIWWLRTNPDVDRGGVLRLRIQREANDYLVAVATKDKNLRYDVSAWCSEFMTEEEVNELPDRTKGKE